MSWSSQVPSSQVPSSKFQDFPRSKLQVSPRVRMLLRVPSSQVQVLQFPVQQPPSSRVPSSGTGLLPITSQVFQFPVRQFQVPSPKPPTRPKFPSHHCPNGLTWSGASSGTAGHSALQAPEPIPVGVSQKPSPVPGAGPRGWRPEVGGDRDVPKVPGKSPKFPE